MSDTNQALQSQRLHCIDLDVSVKKRSCTIVFFTSDGPK